MRKVLYITTVSRTINAFLVPHIQMLIDNGYKVDIACSIDKEIDRSLINKGVRVYDIPFSRQPLSSSNIKAFRKLIEIQNINNYDIDFRNFWPCSFRCEDGHLVRSESEMIIDNAKKEAESVREEIIANAKTEAESILTKANQQIEKEREEMLKDINTQIIDVAMAASTKLLEEKDLTDIDANSIDNFVKEINEKRAN